MAKITLIGLMNYLDENNDDLFTGVSLPTGMNLARLKEAIILRGAEFEILYGSAPMMKWAVKAWADKHYRTFERWVNALSIDYDPLENYDRKESWSDAKSSTRKESGSSSDASGSASAGANENKRAAFDSSSYSPVDKDENTMSTSTFGSNNTQSEGTGSEGALHQGRIHGNIGVKTTQSMLLEEWDVARLNIYEEAADLFCSELLIYTY